MSVLFLRRGSILEVLAGSGRKEVIDDPRPLVGADRGDRQEAGEHQRADELEHRQSVVVVADLAAYLGAVQECVQRSAVLVDDAGAQ
ncbi:MAG: hypothetical protein L0H59_00605 [Tomitella sp.]|nr:hypothetical protein [Tomitella sp.]